MCRDQFKLSKIKFDGKCGDCAKSPFLRWPFVFGYRFVIALYCLCWLIYSGFHRANGKTKWFIYITNWAFLVETIYFIYAAAITLWYHVREKKNATENMEKRGSCQCDENGGENCRCPKDIPNGSTSPMKCHHKVMWLIFNISADTAILVTIIYWCLKFRGKTSALDITNHALNSLFIIIELMLSGLEIRLLHVVYPFVFAMCYLIFSVIYWAAGGTNTRGRPYVYRFVDYTNNPGLAVGVILGGAIVGIPIGQALCFGLYMLRCYCAKRCGRTGSAGDVTEDTPLDPTNPAKLQENAHA